MLTNELIFLKFYRKHYDFIDIRKWYTLNTMLKLEFHYSSNHTFKGHTEELSVREARVDTKNGIQQKRTVAKQALRKTGRLYQTPDRVMKMSPLSNPGV